MTPKQSILFQSQDLPLFSQTAPRGQTQAYTPTPAAPAQMELKEIPGNLNLANEKVRITKIKTFAELPAYVDFVEYRGETVERAIELFNGKHGLPLEVFSYTDSRHYIR